MSGTSGGAGIISIPGYPSTNRVPGVFCVVDATKANTGQPSQRGLIIGQMLAAGTAAANIAVVSAGTGDAQAQYGTGSQLSTMLERWRALDLTGEVWCAPLADAVGSAAATWTLVFTGPASAAGTIFLYIDGFRVQVPVNNLDTATVMGASAVAAVNAFTTPGNNLLSLVATNAPGTGTITLTARNKGTIGNQSTVLLSFGGTANGEGPPGTPNVAGVGLTITANGGGATDPVLTTLLANLPPIPFDFIVCPYNDNTSLNALQAFLGDAAGRWNWSVQMFGGVFTAKGGSLATRTSWSTGRNDQHAAAIGAYLSPSPDWHWAVDFAAASAVSIRADPAIPIGGLAGGAQLNVVPPAPANQDTFAEQEVLLYDGMSTWIATAGVVYVQRAITTYQFNGAGAPSNAYLNLNVPYQLMAYIRARNTMLSSQFNQYGLVADGSRIPPGLKRTTAQLIALAVIGFYRTLDPALVQESDKFAANVAWQNAGGGVVKLMEPVMLAGQLIAIAADIQFRQP